MIVCDIYLRCMYLFLRNRYTKLNEVRHKAKKRRNCHTEKLKERKNRLNDNVKEIRSLKIINFVSEKKRAIEYYKQKTFASLNDGLSKGKVGLCRSFFFEKYFIPF